MSTKFHQLKGNSKSKFLELKNLNMNQNKEIFNQNSSCTLEDEKKAYILLCHFQENKSFASGYRVTSV